MSIAVTLALLAFPLAQTPARDARPAAEFIGKAWLNTEGGKPVTLAGRQGKITLVHFWTFACSNCVANLAAYSAWQKQFEKDGVLVIGIHTPELDFERDEKNVIAAMKKRGITYPVLLDPDFANWKKWDQEYWPTVYVLDKENRIRYKWTGELAWKGADGEQRLTTIIRGLLKE